MVIVFYCCDIPIVTSDGFISCHECDTEKMWFVQTIEEVNIKLAKICSQWGRGKLSTLKTASANA